MTKMPDDPCRYFAQMTSALDYSYKDTPLLVEPDDVDSDDLQQRGSSSVAEGNSSSSATAGDDDDGSGSSSNKVVKRQREPNKQIPVYIEGAC